MTKDEEALAIFGAADGLTSTIAVVIAQLITGTQQSLVAAGFAIAIAAGVGMGYAEWLGDRTSSTRSAAVMAVATLTASALPIIPFLFLWKKSGIIVSLIVAIGVAVAVAVLRGSLTPDSYKRSVIVTFGGIFLISVLVSIPSVLVG